MSVSNRDALGQVLLEILNAEPVTGLSGTSLASVAQVPQLAVVHTLYADELKMVENRSSTSAGHRIGSHGQQSMRLLWMFLRLLHWTSNAYDVAHTAVEGMAVNNVGGNLAYRASGPSSLPMRAMVCSSVLNSMQICHGQRLPCVHTSGWVARCP